MNPLFFFFGGWGCGFTLILILMPFGKFAWSYRAQKSGCYPFLSVPVSSILVGQSRQCYGCQRIRLHMGSTVYGHTVRNCAGSWLWEKNSAPSRGLELLVSITPGISILSLPIRVHSFSHCPSVFTHSLTAHSCSVILSLPIRVQSFSHCPFVFSHSRSSKRQAVNSLQT